jgi:serine/threonine protein kinase
MLLSFIPQAAHPLQGPQPMTTHFTLAMRAYAYEFHVICLLFPLFVSVALAGESSTHRAGAKSAPGDAFFCDEKIHTFRFELAGSALGELNRNERAYVRAQMSDGKHVYSDLGTHLKGMGSFQPLTQKPSFTVKLDRFVPGQRYHGLKKFMLNNSVQDSTFLAEWLSSQMFRDAGVPAARATHAFVEFNGRQLGLYVLVEAANSDFLTQHFRNGRGNLYEGYMQDIDQPLDQDGGPDNSQQDLKKLLEICRIEDPLERWRRLPEVLDAGATDAGRPYFVMELVGGIKITDFCDQNNLITRQRLDLFVQVCRDIQHAHQKGIIHRDIKPSNVLVALQDGVAVPKVIDFGIAKATGGRLTDQTLFAAVEQFIGTPAYMSPEQAQFGGVDVDTRSDIYTLGVLLYELLTGKTPFDTREMLAAGLDEMRRTIREKEPASPSTRVTQERPAARSAVSGKSEIQNPKSKIDKDLDWIVMRCLEKDRARRYETASGLARDIERHLNQEPVVARPASTLYRIRKFIRRNRVTAAGATAIAVVLVLGVTVSTWQAVHARRAGREQIRLRGEAEAAKQEMRESLRSSRLSEARALRVSGQPGRRFQSLAALSNAAAIRPSVELRNEAIASMTQVDIQLARTWKIPLGQEVWL